MSTENALLTILVEKIGNDTMTLPTLPEVAVKIRRVADDPKVNLNKMGDVIANDPALSARMMRVANSPMVARQIKVETINQAVTRIGLRQIKNIATAMAMEQLFVSKNTLIKNYLDTAWQKAVEISTVAIALMQAYLQENKHSSLNVDTITLAALVHNIGVLPILTEAERHEDVFANPKFLSQAIQKLAGRIGGIIMKTWEFTPEFAEVAEKWSDFKYEPKEVSYVDFVRIGAIHSGVLTKVEKKDQLMRHYVAKGILSSHDFLEKPEFLEVLDEVKTAFA